VDGSAAHAVTMAVKTTLMYSMHPRLDAAWQQFVNEDSVNVVMYMSPLQQHEKNPHLMTQQQIEMFSAMCYIHRTRCTCEIHYLPRRRNFRDVFLTARGVNPQFYNLCL